MIAKLLVPGGGLIHDSCGETFSPVQFGFCGSLARVLATFGGISWPSLKVLEESANSFSCAVAGPVQANATAPARIRRGTDGAMVSSLRILNLLSLAWAAASAKALQ